MTARASMVHSTVDFGRPYKDIVHRRGYWVMEEWLHWTETWSIIILQPYKHGSISLPILHDKDTLKMWQALQAICLHFMRAFAEHDSEARCQAVAGHLRAYSKAVERKFGPSECKYNLHLIVCRQVSISASASLHIKSVTLCMLAFDNTDTSA